MLKARYIAAFLVFAGSLMSVNQGIAQDLAFNSTSKDSISQTSNIKGPLEFKGRVEELNKRLKGAIVTLYETPDGSHDNLTEIFRTVTPGNGRFDFKLEVNKMFVLSMEKGGYTTKRIDFDTDVTLSRSNYTTVPKFEFRVDMVKDLDGLAFIGSVASVFYQIKQNKFDYELDYSKEEMEEEERLLREQKEKRRLAELAAQKKFEIEEAAKLLLEKDNATAQEIIKAAIKVGDGDKSKTVKGFLNVFSEVDTLRNKKALAMYDQLLEERKTTKATGGEINFQAIFNSANELEEKVVSESEEQRNAKVEILRKEKEDAKRKMDEAQAIQQKALEEQMKETMQAAAEKEELRKRKAEKQKRDNVYYAIFDSNGDSETAIQNLIKAYPKGDAYAERKAKALFAEYEKSRLTGTTLSGMDFNKLFRAAEDAEQAAIKEDIDFDNAKQNSKMEAFKKKVEEQKQKQQTQVITKIEAGLKEALKDRASQVAVFKNALPKNEIYKDERAEAMYNAYQMQQKLSGLGTATMDFGAIFRAADEAETASNLAAKEDLRRQKLKAQDQLDARREEIRDEKREMASDAEKALKEVHQKNATNIQNKKAAELKLAIENGVGDRDNSVRAIMETLPQSGDKELDRDRAEAVYDAYLKEARKAKQSGSSNSSIDFGGLFKAADNAELAKLQWQYESKQAQQELEHQEYEERRTDRLTEQAKAEQKKAVKEVERAEIAYQSTVHKVEVKRQERLAEQKKAEEERTKQIAMEQARRLAKEKEREDVELVIVKQEQAQRIRREKQEADLLAAKKKAELDEQERVAQEEADRKLAAAEKSRREAELAAAKAGEDARREEQRRIAAEEKAKQDAQLAAAKAADQARKAEEKRLTDLAKAEELKVLATAKAADEARKAEEKRLADLAKANREKELAVAKAAEEARLAEKKRQEQLAQQKAEQAEQQRQADYNRLISEGDLAIVRKDHKKGWQSYKDALALYPDNKDAKGKFNEADAELKRIDRAAAEKLALDQRYNKYMLEGEEAFTDGEYDLAISKYQQASDLKPKEQNPKQKIRNTNRKIEDIAQAKKDAQAKERKYILKMQDGAKALESKDLDLAKSLYLEAARLKPEATEPTTKLNEIAELEDQLAAAALEKQRKETEARIRFEEQQALAQKQKEEQLALDKRRNDAREKALQDVAQKKKEQENETQGEKEKTRIDNYKKLQQAIKQMDLTAEEQRLAFLSELAKIYPEGLTKETVEGPNFVLSRHVINENSQVTVYEKKSWDWGGVFYFKDSDIAITEAIYKLEIGKY